MRACYPLQKGHLELIIFTVTNQVTGQVYVGSTRNDLECQWEKMVAAAEQNMDYPLYREIRTQGADNFLVEEWDCTDERSELAMLEREAIDIFNARSLKGYKTSTVKIQPKKKVRQRKSSIEKELASLFAEFSGGGDDSDEIPAPATKKKATTNAISQTTELKQQPAASVSKPIAAAFFETEAKKSEEKEEPQATSKEQPAGGSQANSVVQMNGINLSDDITAQLAAIQAAADAAIAGDTTTAAELNFAKKEEKIEKPAASPITPIHRAAEQKPAEVVVEIDPKEQRIRDAIERHRKARAQKTAEVQAAEKQKIAKLLSELEARAADLQRTSLAVAA